MQNIEKRQKRAKIKIKRKNIPVEDTLVEDVSEQKWTIMKQ